MDIDARYEFLDKVGSGSFATVYRARDLELGREVAVKQIHAQYLDDPDQLERYWEEAQLLASLHHPNIVTIFDIYRERGWLILELMQSNLAERMAGRQMDLRALRTAIAHSLRALKYLHARGIIHGDIKPGNLMIDARRRVKLGDFGLARRVSDDEGSLLKGTTKYMAPETVSDEFGDIGPASDLYSLGFTAYELMCGPNFESLFPGLSAFGRNKQVAWMMWHAAADRKLPEINRVLEGVPDDLRQVIQKLCEKDQSKRYSGADDALSDLKIDIKIVNKGEPESDESETPSKMDPERRKRLLLAGAAMVASLIVCAVILFLPKKEEKKPRVRYWVVNRILDNRRVKLVEFHGEHAEIKTIAKNAIINLTHIGKAEPIAFEELRTGDRVTLLEVRDDGDTIVRMEAARPIVDRGKDAEIHQQDKAFLVSLTGKRSGERLTLRIPEDDDKHLVVLKNVPRKEWQKASPEERKNIEKLNSIRLTSIRPQDTVEFYHLPDVEGRRGRVLSGLVFVYQTETRSGVVVDTDLPKRILTVQFSDKTRKALEVSENATINRLGRDGKTAMITFEDIKRKDRVTVTFMRSFDEILVKEAKELSGTIVRFEQARTRLRVRPAAKNSNDDEFRIDDGTEIYIAGEQAKVSELRPYDEVTVLFHGSDGRKTAIEISAAKRVRRDRRAMVVGVSTFEDQTLPGLRYSSENVALLDKMLVNRYGVERETGRMVRLDKQPRIESIRTSIEDLLSRSGEKIQVIVYLSTHAFVVDDKVYLAGWDLDSKDIAKTGWLLDDLLQKMEQCASTDKTLLLDISHKWDSRPPAPQPSGAAMMQLTKVPLKSTVVITANSGNERGAYHKNRSNSAFAWYLAEAYRGGAYANEDALKISSAELWTYLSKQMKNAELSGAGTQTPARFPKP